MWEHRGLDPSRAGADAGVVVRLTDGQYLVSENNRGSGWSPQCEYLLKDRRDAAPPPDPNRTAANGNANGTQMYRFAAPAQFPQFPQFDHLERSIFLAASENDGTCLDYTAGYKMSSLPNTAFFPTDLEICNESLESRSIREGLQRHNSLDSEDEDYYDNDNLPFYASDSLRFKTNVSTGVDNLAHPETGDHLKTGLTDSAQETDRLRTQLKEAYYLLINAMHDISFDSQVGVNGLADQASTSSCHSEDSVCSAKVGDSDAWSTEDPSPQQVSDTDSWLVNQPCPQSFLISKSFENLPAVKSRSPLQRSASDGAIKYPQVLCVKSHASHTYTGGNGGQSEMHHMVGQDRFAQRLSSYDGLSSDDLLQECGDMGLLNESSGSVNSLTGSSDSAEARSHKQDLTGDQGVCAKPHGVTVNKMQEWMQKGRMLSSEMKQRITWSSLRVRDASGPVAGHAVRTGTRPTAQTTRSQGSKSIGNMPPCQGAQQTALIENVHSSSVGRREVRVSKFNEANEARGPVNSITVSKKRNWLQQSSSKGQVAEDILVTVTAEEDPCNVSNPPCPSSEEHRQPPVVPSVGHRKPLRPQPAHVTVTQAGTASHRLARPSLPQPRAVDPAEENDADDEGEIWYNPIPEDEEPELSRGTMAEWRPSAQMEPQAPAAGQRKLSVGDGVRGSGCTPSSSDSLVDCKGAPAAEVNHTSSTHSMERTQLHRQKFVCKAGDENTGPRPLVADATCTSNTGFSPPPSPNPSKKGSSINWSFPDKIKSPRTVRKLSMKMKKLPELSRKLSVKGTSSSSQPEHRPSSPKSNGSSSGTESSQGHNPLLSPTGGSTTTATTTTAASRNVISRYHLDSSVSTQQSYNKKKSSGASKSASKGGYLSDGDSPELVAKSGKHGSDSKAGKCKEPPNGGAPKLHGTEIDIDAFRHYSFSEQPKCSQYISGLMSVHFYGAEDLKPPRLDSRDVYCAIQVDSVNKARTALLTCRTSFLDMDHTFNIELENAQHLKLVVFSWEPTPRRNRVCCHGTVVLPTLFRVTRTHQLAVKLEPRGMIYVKLTLMEQWQNSLDSPDGEREPAVFGVEAWRVVERENAGLVVPLLIEKCITEIEKRGCQVVGLYRLCGSAAVKKELREAFERDSKAVEISENQYPDINVITGVLKDYLRELPYPLITKQLYEAVLEHMAKRPLRIGAGGCENDPSDTEHTVSLLDHLPEVEKATLKMLLDHLKLVASYHEVNKMTCQNLAVCFGPVLLSQRQDASNHSNRVFIDSEELASALDFKKHIEVLHYLLQLWPVIDPHAKTAAGPGVGCDRSSRSQYVRRRRERPQVLNLSEVDMAGVLRPRPGRLDSPSNRYAGDWSRCGESYFQPPSDNTEGEADYDDVPSEDAGSTEEVVEDDEREEEEEGRGGEQGEEGPKPEEPINHILSQSPDPPAKEHTYQAYMKIQEISPGLSHRVNLKDLQESIDTLIGNLERELNKNKLNVGY